MKLFSNLPGNLRALFGFLRFTTIITGFLWILAAIFHGPLLWRLIPESSLPITIGHVALQPAQQSAGAKAANAKPEMITVHSLRGTVSADLGGRDFTLQAKVMLTAYPAMAVLIVTSYLLFTALRKVCANLEAGQVFTEENHELVRRVGRVLVVSSLVNAVLGVSASAIMGAYLREQARLENGLEIAGAMAFDLPSGPLSIPTGLVVGCLVLMLTAAFRQGLNLKTENDLTV
jgi:hypothetical protein